ncbi:MAG: AMP-dependent synthetase/ligase [Candidatus Binatia bacterium]
MTGPTVHALGRHIGEIFFQRVDELGQRTFLKLQRGDRFEDISWRDFGALVQNLLLAFYSLGLHAGEPIAIIGENSLEWLCADLATMSGGFPNVVIAPALSDGLLLKILGHSACRAAFVQNSTGVGRLRNLQPQLPALSHVLVMGEHAARLPGTVGFTDLIEIGKRANPSRVYELLESVSAGKLATIMYTSGSTGEPKGVMRTQENLLSNITNGGAIVVSKSEEMTVIVLSLNHLLGRFAFLKSAVTGRTTAIVEAAELELDLGVIQSLNATALTVVPRVMEKIWLGLLDQGDNRQLWQELEALDGEQSAVSLDEQKSRQFKELKTTLGHAVQVSLGGRIKYISYSGAAMPPRIMRFFELIGIPLIGSYGSTECGGITLCGIGENRPGNLGKPFANVEIRIADDSEILVRGPTVTPGYFKNPAATREALDADGWFHTGDLGALDNDGSLRIIGRKKDIFNCIDGSNIYPDFIELRLEDEAAIRQAVLLGDRRPFVAALIVADRRKIAATLGREESALTNDEILAALWSDIERVNRGLEHYEQVRKIALIEEDFPSEVRSLNVFAKVKVDRSAAAQRYAKQIDALYASTLEGETL